MSFSGVVRSWFNDTADVARRRVDGEFCLLPEVYFVIPIKGCVVCRFVTFIRWPDVRIWSVDDGWSCTVL